MTRAWLDMFRRQAWPLCLAVLSLLVTGSASGAPGAFGCPAADADGVRVLAQARRSGPGAQSAVRTLPDWPEAPTGGDRWMRYEVDLDCPFADGPRALLMQGLIAHANVRFNGAPLNAPAQRTGTALPRGLDRLLLLPLPTAQWQAQGNRIEIDVRPQPWASVSTLQVGPAEALARRHRGLSFALVIGPVMAAVVVGALALCVGWLWWRLRDGMLLLFAGGALAWSVQTLMPLVPWPPFGGPWYALLWESLYGLVVVLLGGFCLRLAERRWVGWQRGLVAVALSAPALLPLAHALDLHDIVSTLWRAALLVLMLLALASLARAAWRLRNLASLALLLVSPVALAFSVHDWLADLDERENNPLRLTAYAGLLFAGVVVVVLIDRYVRAAREVEVLNRDLERRVEQQGRQLRDNVAQLTLARDAAQAADRAKTRFLASASHDLRQPMHAIGLLVDLLRVRVTAPDQRVLADKTHQAVQSMEALFGSLLDVSKLDAGAVQPQPQPFALQALLDHVAATHAPLAQAKGLRLRLRPTPLWTDTDPALLERIVGNLVVNAIRYTRGGGVLVACRPRAGQVVLQVIDSGVGIAADRQQLVFEEFVRLDEGQPGDKGLGLGLAIVRRTARLLGLAVNLRSCPGRGSTFEVILPRVSGRDATVDAHAPADASALQGAFVLVVDDDEANLQASAALLRDWGCLVATASNADAAVAEAGRHLRSPDAIVTDLRLGGGDHGLALIRRLRALAGHPLPALLVTADVKLPQPLDGDVQVLRKPCGATRLRQALRQALGAAS